MAKLTGREIERERAAGHIVIEPFTEAHVGPNSYDLTLGKHLLVYTDDKLDMKREPQGQRIEIPESGYTLYPGTIYLGVTNEIAGSDFFVPCIEGRSSVARLGLAVHITAGFGDLGFKNRWTLEMVAFKPIRVYAGVRICQVYFETARGVVRPYKGKYTEPSEYPVPSRIFRELEDPAVTDLIERIHNRAVIFFADDQMDVAVQREAKGLGLRARVDRITPAVSDRAFEIFQALADSLTGDGTIDPTKESLTWGGPFEGAPPIGYKLL